MNKDLQIKFFNKYDLRGLTYNMQLRSKSSEYIHSISKRISNLGGVNYFPNNKNY